jgi:hypothetical protein
VHEIPSRSSVLHSGRRTLPPSSREQGSRDSREIVGVDFYVIRDLAETGVPERVLLAGAGFPRFAFRELHEEGRTGRVGPGASTAPLHRQGSRETGRCAWDPGCPRHWPQAQPGRPGEGLVSHPPQPRDDSKPEELAVYLSQGRVDRHRLA